MRKLIPGRPATLVVARSGCLKCLVPRTISPTKLRPIIIVSQKFIAIAKLRALCCYFFRTDELILTWPCDIVAQLSRTDIPVQRCEGIKAQILSDLSSHNLRARTSQDDRCCRTKRCPFDPSPEWFHHTGSVSYKWYRPQWSCANRCDAICRDNFYP